MTYYEIKKVFAKTSSKLSLAVLCIVLIVVCNFATGEAQYVNENGDGESGRAAIAKLREQKQQWEGPLTSEKLEKVIRQHRKINASPEAKSDDVQELDKAYAKTQGYGDIRDLLSCAFGDFIEFDYYAADSLKPKDAEKFYDSRISSLKDWLDGTGSARFTEEEKAFLVSQYKELKTPLDYKYADGWEQVFYSSPMLLIFTIFIIGFLLSGIFSCESQLKTDSVFYSSYHGRRKAVLSKLKAALLIASVIYWVMVLLYTGFVLWFFGAGGSDCMVQSNLDGWKIFYNITIGQEYLLIVLGGYVGCLFFSALLMLISAKTKSPVLAAAVPFILFLIPTVLDSVDSDFLKKVLGIMPHQLMQISRTIRNLDLYSAGEKVMGSIPILFVLYLALFLVIGLVLYQSYRRAEVK
ncbi:ABC transporter permease subunit [Anaerovorax odorimutans]|uniref:ABC transporter permease subunit n=1 Tax=Anaerovorax odorimutans TaxID=109327 RepID=A0ABT1RMI9_9FIRM|nr:ABC transporter permease subunit [Anaerovorax odorimutans]MCQ4636410.1 ABC transporter permease subunit [Anaerovorax odorimutans]